MWRRYEAIVAVMEIVATTGFDTEDHALLDEMAFTKRMVPGDRIVAAPHCLD